ncbi:group II intron maturase-specific domain-containing protein [Roseateles sp.]|uniref:group II intron maturase-specific domain-containing protein n=1 Tax=Roseateles sp. TaxID=1971397 RepID=UPI0039E94B45
MLTMRSCGRSMAQVVPPRLLGWTGYFRMAQTPYVMRELDEWLRHRMRTSNCDSGNAEQRCIANCCRWALVLTLLTRWRPTASAASAIAKWGSMRSSTLRGSTDLACPTLPIPSSRTA